MFLIFVAGIVAGFVAGLLVGANNPGLVKSASHTIEADASDFVNKAAKPASPAVAPTSAPAPPAPPPK